MQRTTSRAFTVWNLLPLILLAAVAAHAGSGALELRDGYFWDPLTGGPFIPHGFAYQTFNPPVYANQTTGQLDYDLEEMKAMHANSLRVEFTWSQVETNESQYDFTKIDHLIAKAEDLGLKLFVLMGYQYPPGWFSTNYPVRMATHYDTTNGTYGQSQILNYSCPEAQASYASYVSNVCARFKDSPAIGGWIVGNEFAYFDLWEPNQTHRFVGYDTNYSLPSFRGFLSNKYSVVANLNTNWATAYASFSDVPMALVYPTNRENQLQTQQRGYHDLIQWRKQEIGDFLAAGVAAARSVDTNHLITYAMVGGIFNGRDDNITCEDAEAIVERCQAAGAPVDFWTINNYPWTLTGSEMRSEDYGVSKYRELLGLPVMVSECGLSSNDGIFPETATRQATAMASLPWEAIMSGAIGVHIFHWSDRDEFLTYNFPLNREAGFGIVQDDRTIKDPVFWNVLRAFRLMEEIDVGRLFAGSDDPADQILAYWGLDQDLGWNRANQELAMCWATFKRLGYQIGIMDEEQFDAQAYTNADAIFLPRAWQLDPDRLDELETLALAQGVHVHAGADLPGRFNTYHASNANWLSRMDSIFGLNVAAAVPGWESGATFIPGYKEYSNVQVTVVGGSYGHLTNNFKIGSWKIWHGVAAGGGGSNVATHTGSGGLQPAMPAIRVRNHASAKAAAVTFAWADIQTTNGWSSTLTWDVRRDVAGAIYGTYFGITPALQLSGNGGWRHVAADYRTCSNGTMLVSLLNLSTIDAQVTVTASNIFYGKKVENLTRGGVITQSAGTSVAVPVDGDEFVLLYVYDAGATDNSLVNTSPEKIWVEWAPMRVWPNGTNYQVFVGYDTLGAARNLRVAFERLGATRVTNGLAATIAVSGLGVATSAVPVPDADLGDANYVSSMDGGSYVLHAWLESGGTVVSDSEIPVDLLWGVRPASLPATVETSTLYNITVEWQNIPSYLSDELPTPLHRADVWPAEEDDTAENYWVALYLLDSNSTAVATSKVVTSTGTSSNTLSITTPATLPKPPYSWKATLEVAGAKKGGNINESFEDRALGDHAVPGSAPDPWVLTSGGTPGDPGTYLNRGTDELASQGTKGSWQAYQSHVNPGNYSYYNLTYTYNEPFPITNGLNNTTFSFDFLETSGFPCRLEMHVRDNGAGVIFWTNMYAHTGNWHTNTATLNQFSGALNTNEIKMLVVSVSMLQTNTTYVGHIDNIRFTGAPETYEIQEDPVYDVADGFEDRSPGAGKTVTAPWDGFFYAENNLQTYWVEGVDQVAASEGVQSAFLLGQIGSPVTWSGHGFARTYASAWALPDTSLWSQISFQFDYRETNMITGDLLLKIEDSAGGAIESRAAYGGGWQTISNTLNHFTISGYPGTFNPNAVKKLVVILDSKGFSGIYYARFDNIRFTGADELLGFGMYTGAMVQAVYYSINDADDTDSDGDGIRDIYETDTDVYNGPTDTGTDPNDPDSDDDGQNDGDEVVAGTNPNNPNETFEADAVVNEAAGFVVEWFARTGRVYSIHYTDGSLVTNGTFAPLGSFTNITVPANCTTSVVDTTYGSSDRRYYRVQVRQ